jgi:hypothetical protein
MVPFTRPVRLKPEHREALKNSSVASGRLTYGSKPKRCPMKSLEEAELYLFFNGNGGIGRLIFSVVPFR